MPEQVQGRRASAARLKRFLTADRATGVIRHADAGYESDVLVAQERGVNLGGTC